MRVLVCGGREYYDQGRVYQILDMIHREVGISEIIHGAATGADSLAGQWAILNNIKETKHPAEWKRYGKPAGPIRNRKMLRAEVPDMVVAFPGGDGTRDMINLSRSKKFKVLEVK